MPNDDPYHEGEKLVQEKAGEQLAAERNGRAINTSIMPGALKFIAQQPMAVLGSVDDEQNVWASIFTGQPGFVAAPDPQTVTLDLTQAGSHPHDPVWANIIERQPQVGMLLIEPSSRRRLRVNGRIDRVAPSMLQLDVAEAYPNCPQYIQRRDLRRSSTAKTQRNEARFETGQSLTAEQKDWIGIADTFFVASLHPRRGADVSHRGGEPGFVCVIDDRTLRVPDYAGNSMFNTLGNFEANPRAGLVFVDFKRQRVLQMTGRPTIRWDLEEDESQPTGGTRRYWDFAVERWIEADLEFPLEAEFLDYWDRNPKAG